LRTKTNGVSPATASECPHRKKLYLEADTFRVEVDARELGIAYVGFDYSEVFT
jgi:hypothetical protein